ncbi:YheC/YheD family protein [Alkalihalobacillus sp. MEB130]|uniref:YheC/YheD family endospore coat-associated protein n=1 Tax=Alkalihalobacillus sp. MEB130 TaxID=2976704 RepID=UPI0028E02A6C|nr:YheC/YheD family protein [Alkalihalobacillus sp. MEB130]MDT8860369.1 YheC/YheD family protein [Alkalihalobacillus sp. MEB130]
MEEKDNLPKTDVSRDGQKPVVQKKYTIGLLVSRSNKRVKKYLTGLLDLADCCEDGVVVVFSLKGISRERQVINGYLYNASERKWEPATFSIPDAIINRISLKRKWVQYFEDTVGCNMINNFTFSKWDMYQWLSKNPNFNKYLPLTQIITEPKVIIDFLEQYKEGYIKPINGSYGKGIYKISKEDEIFKLDVSRDRKKTQSMYVNYEELTEYFRKICKRRNYIIQQVIDLYVVDRPVDFRLITVKNGLGEWRDVGLLARKGVKGEIVSNTGVVKNGNSALQNVLSIRRNEAIELRKKMIDVSLEAAKEMERYGGPNGNLGNLGFDLAIDRNKNLWIIEINHRNPRHRMAVDAGESGMYVQANKLMMDFAITLAKAEGQ